MGQSKIEVFRRLLGSEDSAWRANQIFEESYAESVRTGMVVPLQGAVETMTALRAAGIKVCLATGFAPVTRDAAARRAGLAAADRPGAHLQRWPRQAGGLICR